MTRTIGDEVEYDGEPGTKGTVVEYTENGDWVTVDWQIAPKARGNGWHKTHMKAFHLRPLNLEH